MTDNQQPLKSLKPFDINDNSLDTNELPIFAEPWQAEALAIADTLIQQGLFSATQWSNTLGQKRKEAEESDRPDTQDHYYQCVLSALELLVSKYSDIGEKQMEQQRSDWEKAYLSTPHGQPVKL